MHVIFGAVAVAAPADVVAVGAAAAVGDGADELASALRAGDQSGEPVWGGVGGSLADLGGAFVQNAGGEVELVGGTVTAAWRASSRT
jgi:hypothetical protein